MCCEKKHREGQQISEIGLSPSVQRGCSQSLHCNNIFSISIMTRISTRQHQTYLPQWASSKPSPEPPKKIALDTVDPTLIPAPPPPKGPPPTTFYRVHHRHSFTRYALNQGFTANGGYQGHITEWLNKEVIESHLRASDRPGKLSSFISVFGDEGVYSYP